jgi:hypothetical protein
MHQNFMAKKPPAIGVDVVDEYGNEILNRNTKGFTRQV